MYFCILFPDEISGSNYYLNIDKIHAGSVIGDNVAGGPKPNNYIGYLQNFQFNDLRLLEKLRQLPPSAQNIYLFYFNEEGRLPSIVYNQITMMSRSSFLSLTNQHLRPTLISFMFKTLESSGVIFYAGGANGDFLAVELEDGYIKYIYDVNNRPAILPINTEYKLNNNEWHSVTIRQISGREHIISVDETVKRINPQTQGINVNLNRAIYVSGLPPNMYDLPNIRRSITSRHGFQGCLASFNLNGFVPDLASHASSNQYAVSGCTSKYCFTSIVRDDGL